MPASTAIAETSSRWLIIESPKTQRLSGMTSYIIYLTRIASVNSSIGERRDPWMRRLLRSRRGHHHSRSFETGECLPWAREIARQLAPKSGDFWRKNPFETLLRSLNRNGVLVPSQMVAWVDGPANLQLGISVTQTVCPRSDVFPDNCLSFILTAW